MRPLQIDLKKIATVTSILAVLVIVGVLLLGGATPEEATGALIRTGLAITVNGAFWALYNKHLWKWRVFRLFGWLSPAPDLSGRWEGTVLTTPKTLLSSSFRVSQQISLEPVELRLKVLKVIAVNV